MEHIREFNERRTGKIEPIENWQDKAKYLPADNNISWIYIYDIEKVRKNYIEYFLRVDFWNSLKVNDGFK